MATAPASSEFSVRALGTGDGATRVVVAGEVDLETAPALEKVLRAELAAGRPVRLDLAAVEFFDSAAVTVLIHAGNDAIVNAWDLTISGDLPPVVERVMRITGVHETLPLVIER